VVLEVVLDLLEVRLDSLNLHKGWVRQLRKKTEAFIDGSECIIMLSNIRFESFMLFLSNKGFLIQRSSVLVDICLKLFQSVGQSASGGEQHVVDHIVAVEDVWQFSKTM
jgi:hypothetical protein